MKIFVILFLILKEIASNPISTLTGGDSNKEIAIPRPPPQKTIIQTQNSQHYDEDLTGEILDRNKRSFMIDSIGNLLQKMNDRISFIENNFNDKMNRIQNAIQSIPESEIPNLL